VGTIRIQMQRLRYELHIYRRVWGLGSGDNFNPDPVGDISKISIPGGAGGGLWGQIPSRNPVSEILINYLPWVRGRGWRAASHSEG